MRHRRHHRSHGEDAGRHDGGRAATTAPPASYGTGDVLVRIAPPLSDRLEQLATALGPGYTVEAGLPTAGALAVLRAATPPTVAFWRARYPGAGLFVLDPFGEGRAADCLLAGADAYVAGAVTAAEVAAILRSLARRLVPERLPA